jgi:hypothetical protein
LITCNIGALAPGQVSDMLVYIRVPMTQSCMSTQALQDAVTTVSAIDGNPGNNTANSSVLVTCP